jgi:hypothetical protein
MTTPQQETNGRASNRVSKAAWEGHLKNIAEIFRCLPDPPTQWTIPFIPWCGETYWDVRPRILFVGKSVGCSKDPDAEGWRTTLREWQQTDDPDPRWVTDTYMKEKVGRYQPSSPAFWLNVLLVAGALLPESTESQKLVDSIAWTNIYKVNNSEERNGLPTEADLQRTFPDQFRLIGKSAEWFKHELQVLKPDLVLLGISDQWSVLAKELELNTDHRHERPTMVSESNIARLGLEYQPSGIWLTNHFTAWSQRLKNREHGTLILEMRKTWSGSQANSMRAGA